MIRCPSLGGEREIPMNENFFTGFGKTLLNPEDVVLSVFIPVSKKVGGHSSGGRAVSFLL